MPEFWIRFAALRSPRYAPPSHAPHVPPPAPPPILSARCAAARVQPSRVRPPLRAAAASRCVPRTFRPSGGLSDASRAALSSFCSASSCLCPSPAHRRPPPPSPSSSARTMPPALVAAAGRRPTRASAAAPPAPGRARATDQPRMIPWFLIRAPAFFVSCSILAALSCSARSFASASAVPLSTCVSLASASFFASTAAASCFSRDAHLALLSQLLLLHLQLPPQLVRLLDQLRARQLPRRRRHRIPLGAPVRRLAASFGRSSRAPALASICLWRTCSSYFSCHAPQPRRSPGCPSASQTSCTAPRRASPSPARLSAPPAPPPPRQRNPLCLSAFFCASAAAASRFSPAALAPGLLRQRLRHLPLFFEESVDARAANLRFCSAARRATDQVATTCLRQRRPPARSAAAGAAASSTAPTTHPRARDPCILDSLRSASSHLLHPPLLPSSAASASCSATCGEWWYMSVPGRGAGGVRASGRGGQGGRRGGAGGGFSIRRLDALPLELVFGALSRRDDLRAELLDHGEEDGDLLELRRLIDALRLEHHPLSSRRRRAASGLRYSCSRSWRVACWYSRFAWIWSAFRSARPTTRPSRAAVARDHRRRAALLARLRERRTPLSSRSARLGPRRSSRSVRRHPHLGVELGDRVIRASVDSRDCVQSVLRADADIGRGRGDVGVCHATSGGCGWCGERATAAFTVRVRAGHEGRRVKRRGGTRRRRRRPRQAAASCAPTLVA